MSSARSNAAARQRRAGEPLSAANYVQQQQQQQQEQPQPFSDNINAPPGKIPIPQAILIISSRLNDLEKKFNTYVENESQSQPQSQSLPQPQPQFQSEFPNNQLSEMINFDNLIEKIDFLEQVIYKIDNEKITELDKKIDELKDTIINMQSTVIKNNQQILEFINNSSTKATAIHETDINDLKGSIIEEDKDNEDKDEDKNDKDDDDKNKKHDKINVEEVQATSIKEDNRSVRMEISEFVSNA